MNNLVRKYNALHEREKRILQCLSLLWEPVTADEFQEFLNSLELLKLRESPYSTKYTRLLIRSLTKKGLVSSSQTYWGICYQIADDQLKEVMTREIIGEVWFDKVIKIIRSVFDLADLDNWYSRKGRFGHRLLREFRLSIYRTDEEDIAKTSHMIARDGLSDQAKTIATKIFSEPFQADLLRGHKNDFQRKMLVNVVDHAIRKLQPTDRIWDFARDSGHIDHPSIRAGWILEKVLRGETVEALEAIGDTPRSLDEMLLQATVKFLEQEYSEAAGIYDQAIFIWKKLTRKRKGFPSDWQMFFYALALYRTGDPGFYGFAKEFAESEEKTDPTSTICHAVNAVARYLQGSDELAEISFDQIGSEDLFENLLKIIVASIINPEKRKQFAKEIKYLRTDYPYDWIDYEIANLLKAERLYSDHDLRKIAATLNFNPVGNSIPELEDWERSLHALDSFARLKQTGDQSETRIAWILDFSNRTIQPILQMKKNNGWTQGRNIALKHLHSDSMDAVSDQDRAVVRASLREVPNAYRGDKHKFSWSDALKNLAGHPNLFLDKNRKMPVQLISAEPNLIVKESGDDIEVAFDTEFSKEGVVIKKETEVRYKIVEIQKKHIDIAAAWKTKSLRVPPGGRKRLLKALGSLLEDISIHSDYDEHMESLPAIESDSRTYALITALPEGFHLEFFVKPFSQIPPYLKPGKGSLLLAAEVDGVRTRTRRDLAKERQTLNDIESKCPFLASFESLNYDWELVDTESCLTALLELEEPRENGQLVIEWAEGGKLNIVGKADFESTRLSIRGGDDWFELEGEVQISEELTISMRQLLDLTADGSNQRFIELSDRQFIAVTAKFRKQLESLRTILDNKNRFHHLRSGIVENFAGELKDVRTDRRWLEHLTKLKTVKNFKPALPKTFEADLRPYQLEGYEWLSRLAHWGVGACLADDMGLGKTVMALALLVERASLGPALVVAPVSVCRNWIKEALRFAPTLNLQLFGDGDRQETVAQLSKFDVLVTSYSLLQSEEAVFSEKQFATIVLDEAQAIKNSNTKRARTVMNLKAGFRMTTTGTPIENHLHELWSLFNFINPGLLGSQRFFKTQFAVPIEKENDDDARRTLQCLIKPFVLRRRKNQVLDDLPEKTEIELIVQMKPEERAFYESIRRRALERILEDGAGLNDKRFAILAELTRLRLASCHPRLVDDEIPIPSSKLELFAETLEELLENDHRVLVFSQFVKHLKIIQEHLKKSGLEYFYLDGKTPSNIRQQRIDEFQTGARDIFLISLKAGGTGLNLTAADYVIHLDPWWNPAVEDQATDRVHRIGQKRPVTVYRLITEGTVEEKILKLHGTKRGLADSLLEGTNTTGKMSAEDLLGLIRDGDLFS